VTEYAPPILGGRVVSRQGCRAARAAGPLREHDLILCPSTPAAPRRWHNGIDLVSPGGPREGVEVLLPLAGLLVGAYQIDGRYVVGRDEGSAGFGGLAVVEHAPRVLTLYGHLSAVVAQLGAWLPAGAVVGRTGRTAGRPDDPARLLRTPHLHHEWVAAWPLRPERVDLRYDAIASLAACGIVEIDARLVWASSLPRARHVGPGVIASGLAPGPAPVGLPPAGGAGPLVAAALAAAVAWRRRRERGRA
jgi:hypothetical protein